MTVDPGQTGHPALAHSPSMAGATCAYTSGSKRLCAILSRCVYVMTVPTDLLINVANAIELATFATSTEPPNLE
ncbi:hypothetical protein [Pseudopelagicola sp. nBUS_19]|uniref:hypothetical protein n=1 Tax=Pseudopelagicola sp. nBUS_19 TaxID=3395316 RepID=UPI003EB891E3